MGDASIAPLSCGQGFRELPARHWPTLSPLTLQLPVEVLANLGSLWARIESDHSSNHRAYPAAVGQNLGLGRGIHRFDSFPTGP